MTEYSEYINGVTIINHQERIRLGLTNDEYVFYELGQKEDIYKMSYADFWRETGLYPSEIRRLISRLKEKGLLPPSTIIGKMVKLQDEYNSLSFEIAEKIAISKKEVKPKKILFQESEIFDKKKFSEKFKDWPKEKLEYYWTSADAWSEEGNKKINWYKTILTWERRDAKEGRLKFTEQPKETTNFFANR